MLRAGNVKLISKFQLQAPKEETIRIRGGVIWEWKLGLYNLDREEKGLKSIKPEQRN